MRLYQYIVVGLVIFVCAIFSLNNANQAQAGPFAGLFSNNQNTRAFCLENEFYDAETVFNPNAYTQIPASEDAIKRDCSNYGFGLFSSEEVLRKSTVICGSTVQAIYTIEGERDIQDKSSLPINNVASNGYANTFNNLSQFPDQRDNLRTNGDWMLLPHELGSLYTNRAVSTQNPDDLSESNGINRRLNSFDFELQNRINFCGWIAECQSNNEADVPEIKKGEALPRCVNPMNYDVYPDDPDRDLIVNEKDVCDDSRSKLAGYETCPSKYFIPCGGGVAASTNPPSLLASTGGGGTQNNCQQVCNPNYDPDFAAKFLGISPNSRARELVVICQTKAPRTEDSEKNATRFDEAIFVTENKFDCQELIIPPGAVAYCEGILQNAKMLTSANYHEQIDIEFADRLGTAEGMGTLEGPLIRWRENWKSFLCSFPPFNKLGACQFIDRLKEYVKRINFFASQASIDGDLTNICPEQVDAETYGDPGAAVGSSATQIKTQVEWERPSEDAAAYEALLTFTIEPRGFWACSTLMGHVQRQGAQSRLFTPAKRLEQLGEENNASKESPIPFAISGKDSEQRCDPATITSGDIPTESERCRTNITEVKPNDIDNPADTKIGGSDTRFAYLGPAGGGTTSLTKGRKPYFSKENSKAYNCDYYAYTHGLPPPPGCVNPRYASLFGMGPTTGTCEDGTGYCAPDFLAANGWGNYASAASQVCSLEGVGDPQVVNMSCLDGGSYDFSIGLFQMNMVPIPYFDDSGNLVELKEGRCPGAFVTDVSQVGITSNWEYPDTCILNTSSGELPMGECTQYMSASTNISPNFVCTPEIKSCLAQYSDVDPEKAAQKNSAAAAALFSAWGYNWCGPWVNAGEACGLCN
jgi:hypothetical protein